MSLLNGVELEQQFAEFVCYAVSATDVIAEAAAAGFAATASGDLVIMHPGES